MKNRKSILVFDFETTGLNATQDEILEIGAVRYEYENNQLKIVDELELMLNTTVPISDKITKITGITTQMQSEKGVSQEEGFQRLSAMIDEDTLLIAYNIQFDLGFLQQFYHKFYERNYVIKNDVLDVMAVYKDRQRFPHRLESAIETYRITLPNTHRALDDVKATYAVLEAMQIEKDTISSYINVIGYNAKYGVSGQRLSHVTYVPQRGGYGEIERLKNA